MRFVLYVAKVLASLSVVVVLILGGALILRPITDYRLFKHLALLAQFLAAPALLGLLVAWEKARKDKTRAAGDSPRIMPFLSMALVGLLVPLAVILYLANNMKAEAIEDGKYAPTYGLPESPPK